MDVIGFNIEKFIHPGDMKTFNSQFLQQKVTLGTFHSKKDPSTIQTGMNIMWCLICYHAFQILDSPEKEAPCCSGLWEYHYDWPFSVRI